MQCSSSLEGTKLRSTMFLVCGFSLPKFAKASATISSQRIKHVRYGLTEPRIRMLDAVCRQGSVVYSGRFGRTARILEAMQFVTVEYSVVWVSRKRRNRAVMTPRCRWTVRPTVQGFAFFRRLTKPVSCIGFSIVGKSRRASSAK